MSGVNVNHLGLAASGRGPALTELAPPATGN